MSRSTRDILYSVVALFFGIFMLLPLTGLLAAGFTGHPVSVLRVGDFVHELSQSSLKYYLEFLHTPRYRQGLLNSIGLAPLMAVIVWLVGLVTRRTDWFGLPTMVGAGVMASLWAVFWPALFPESTAASLLVPGRTWPIRLLQSLGYCPMVTLVSTAMGVGVAFCIARVRMPFRSTFRLLTILPLSMPPFLGALAFKNLLGDFGMLTRALESVGYSHPFTAQGPLSAGLVQAFLFFPFAVLTTTAALERSDPTLGEAAESLGARKGFAFWTVHLPVLLPGITAGAFLIFIRSFGDFATLRLLLPTEYPVIVIETYRDLSGNTYWGGAAMLSSIMIGVILTLLALQKYFVEGGSFETVTGKSAGRIQLATHPLTVAGALAFCVAVFSVPIAFVGATALISCAKNWGPEMMPPAYTFSRYKMIYHQLLEAEDSPILNSFWLTVPALAGCILMAFVVALLISRSRHWTATLLDFFVMLPFVVPGIAFAVALIGAFNPPPLPLELLGITHFTGVLVIFAYIVTRVPYSVRSTLASFQQIGVSMEESSTTMGATDMLTMAKVTFPLVLPGILAGAVMVFVSAMQDVAITLMIAPPDWFPASVFVFKEIQQGRIYNASAYGIILLFLIMIPYTIAYRVGGVRTGM